MNTRGLKIPDNYFDGEVVKILNDYRILITPGEASFDVGSSIEVLEPALEIEDSNGNIADIYSFRKAKLKVTHVYEKYAIAFSDETETVKGYSALSAVVGSLGKEDREIIKKLNVSQDHLNLQLRDNIIRVGDPIQIIK